MNPIQSILAIESGRWHSLAFDPTTDLPGEMHVTAFAPRMGGIAEVLIRRDDIAGARQVLARLRGDDSPLATAMAVWVHGLLAARGEDRTRAAECSEKTQHPGLTDWTGPLTPQRRASNDSNSILVARGPRRTRRNC